MERLNVQRELEDFRAGQICAVMANCGAPRKGRPHQPSDFFSSLPKPTMQQQSPLEMLAQIEIINAQQNSKQ
jgi:hypothetical protein